MPSRTTSADRKQPQRLSPLFLDVLRKHLAIFSEVYRQPITKLAVMAYAEDLADLSPEELDAACKHARKVSEYLPIPATIIAAHFAIRPHHEFLGPPMIAWADDVTPEEREEALKYSKKLKEVLGPAPTRAAETKPLKVVPPTRTIEEQKKILKKRGLL